MDGNLYADDFHAWALEQAEKLRAISKIQASEVAEVDFDHVIEEIEDLGNEQRFQVESKLAFALSHLIKIHMLPDTEFVGGWRKEARAGLRNAERRFKRSMIQNIDLDDIWGKAVRDTQEDLKDDGFTIPPFEAGACPFQIEWLLDGSRTIDDCLTALSARADPKTSPQAPSNPLDWWGSPQGWRGQSGRSCDRTYSLTVPKLPPPHVQTK